MAILERRGHLWLNVLVVATCGLLYELLAATLASYLLGDAVAQFSVVLGLYLAAMGAGAYGSKHIRSNVARSFVWIEVALAVVGGSAVPLLYLSFSRPYGFRAALYAEVISIGAMVGTELPLLMRLLKNDMRFRDLVSRAFTADYAGGLLASVLFPLVLVPRLGLLLTGLCAGLCNAFISLWASVILRDRIEGGVALLRGCSVLVIALLLFAMTYAPSMEAWTGE